MSCLRLVFCVVEQSRRRINNIVANSIVESGAWVGLMGLLLFSCTVPPVQPVPPLLAAVSLSADDNSAVREAGVPHAQGVQSNKYDGVSDYGHSRDSGFSATSTRIVSSSATYAFHQPIGLDNGRVVKTALAMRVANLSPAACKRQLRDRSIPTKPAAPRRGVAVSVRLDGPLHGVTFRGPGAKSEFSIMDCRLVLALEAFAQVLARHDVAQVLFGNCYRRGSRLGSRIGSRGRKLPRKLSQHAYALAIDITGFVLKDGTRLMLPQDYHGEIGQQSCGPNAVMHEPNERSIRLRNLVCDVGHRGIFHHILTPNYNSAHHEHFHFDIKRDNQWIVIR